MLGDNASAGDRFVAPKPAARQRSFRQRDPARSLAHCSMRGRQGRHPRAAAGPAPTPALQAVDPPCPHPIEPARPHGRHRRRDQGQAAHPSGDAAHRARHAAADLHGLARSDHPGERAADDRARSRQCPRPALADHRLSPGIDRHHPALRQDRRHPRARLGAEDRHRGAPGGLARLRARALDADADPGPRAAGHRRRRARLHGHGGAGRRRDAARARPLLRLFRHHLHHRRRQRPGAGRLPGRPPALVGDLLAQHPARVSPPWR